MAANESNDDRIQSFVAPTAGTTVSHYKVIEKIGSGEMGKVHLAEDTELDRLCELPRFEEIMNDGDRWVQTLLE
jgi:serine/threonine protein kinase